MKISIDENICIGCGLCVSICDRCFELKDNIAKVIKEDCDCDKKEIKEIAENCPTNAIKVI